MAVTRWMEGEGGDRRAPDRLGRRA
jgi:hypothetical protein